MVNFGRVSADKFGGSKFKMGVAPVKGSVLRIAATLGRISGSSADGGNNGTDTQHISRNAHRTGINPVKGLRLVTGNVKLLGATPFGEAGVGNAYDIQAAIEYSGATTRAKWDGANSKVVPDKSVVIRDPIMDLPAAAFFYSRHWLTVASTANKWPRAGAVGANSQQGRTGTDFSANLLATGTIAAGTSSAQHPPLALIGYVPRNTVSVAYIGTSIEDGSGDSTSLSTDGAVSYIGRGLENVNGFNIPSCKMSRGSENLVAYADSISGALRRSMLNYCTHFIGMSITNDIVQGYSLATIQAACLAAWADARARGVQHICWPNVIPRTTSSDAFATLANQTPVSGFELNGIRDQFNSWLPTKLADGTIDSILDFSADCQDATEPTKWRVDLGAGNNTADGTHSAAAAHTLGATRLRALAATWTAS